MKVYIAGRYSRRDEFREYAKMLNAAGIEVTSRWLQETNPLHTQMGDDTKEFYEATSRIDLEDIDRADAVVFFSEDPLQGIPRGGRHVEFGYALGNAKPILVVGPYENVFHYLPDEFNITHHTDIYTVITELSHRQKVWKLFQAARDLDATKFEQIYREVHAVQ